MTPSKITFCNRAYAKRWFKNLERQNPAYFDILRALIEEIEDKDGGDIVKADLYARRPDWPAAGFVDTEIRCLTELESWNAEKEVQPRVQA